MGRIFGLLLRSFLQFLFVALVVGGGLFWLSQNGSSSDVKLPPAKRGQATDILWPRETLAAALGDWCSAPGQATYPDAVMSLSQDGGDLFIQSNLPIPSKIRRSPFKAIVIDKRAVATPERARGYLFEITPGVQSLTVTIYQQGRRKPGFEGKRLYQHQFKPC